MDKGELLSLSVQQELMLLSGEGGRQVITNCGIRPFLSNYLLTSVVNWVHRIANEFHEASIINNVKNSRSFVVMLPKFSRKCYKSPVIYSMLLTVVCKNQATVIGKKEKKRTDISNSEGQSIRARLDERALINVAICSCKTSEQTIRNKHTIQVWLYDAWGIKYNI